MTERDRLAQQAYRDEIKLAEGIEKGKIEIAKNMLAKGVDKSFICEVTGLSLDDLDA